MRRTEIVAEAKNLFQCSEARITTPTRGRHFLIIGYAKTAQWYTGTEEGVTALTVPYVDERCIASGRTYRELREEMLECHRLSQLGDAWVAGFWSREGHAARGASRGRSPRWSGRRPRTRRATARSIGARPGSGLSTTRRMTMTTQPDSWANIADYRDDRATH